MESKQKSKISSFTFLNVTQFLGALNDNIYKLLLVYLFIQIEGIENSHQILAASGAIFVAPFILFSASSGTLADRYSKRNIIIFTKVMELVIMGMGLLAFYTHNKFGSLAILFMLAAQSAIFGPSKYGIIPEIVTKEKISKANGIITSFTFLAIVLGTFFASFILDITDKNFVLAAWICCLFSFIGLATSLGIEYTPPSGSLKKFTPLFYEEIYQSLCLAKKEPSLLLAMVGSAFFLFLAAFVQLNMIPFAVQSLGLTDIQGGYLFILTAVGIGLGSILSGKISGDHVELGLVPIACIGITIILYLLDLHSHQISIVIPLVMGLGLLGGIYQVPLDSYIQVASPHEYRGQFVAATNVMSFLGVLLASCLVYMTTEVFGLKADKGFTLLSFIALIITIIFLFQFWDYLSRFFWMTLSRLQYNTLIVGSENIPQTAAIYICQTTCWKDTLLMQDAQKRRIRFFTQQKVERRTPTKEFFHLVHRFSTPHIAGGLPCSETIRKTLEKGISICLFVEHHDLTQEMASLKNNRLLSESVENITQSLIPVKIEREKNSPP